MFSYMVYSIYMNPNQIRPRRGVFRRWRGPSCWCTGGTGLILGLLAGIGLMAWLGSGMSARPLGATRSPAAGTSAPFPPVTVPTWVLEDDTVLDLRPPEASRLRVYLHNAGPGAIVIERLRGAVRAEALRLVPGAELVLNDAAVRIRLAPDSAVMRAQGSMLFILPRPGR
jgi:hypothetical protein